MSRYRVSTIDGTWSKIEPDFFTDEDPRAYLGEPRGVCPLGVRSYYLIKEDFTRFLVVCDTHSAEFKDAVKHQSYFN